MMHEEFVDIYDDDMKRIGSAVKKDVHKLGLWHKSIHCWLFKRENNHKYVLFQKRAMSKIFMPGYFDVSVAGHYELGEKVSDGFREVNEEFGLDIPNSAWHYLGIKMDVGLSPNTINREFCEVYFAEHNFNLLDIKMSQREVDAVVQIDVEDGKRLFAGEVESIEVKGIKWNNAHNGDVYSSFIVSQPNFIPRTDSYYAKIFTIADLYYNGYKYLYI